MSRILAALLFLVPSPQDEMEDNPEYQAWAGEKPGAWVKWAVETQTGAMKITTELTWTLRECTAEKAVIDEKTVLTLSGETREHTGTRVLLSKIKKGTTSDGAKVKGVTEGEEEVDIKGGKIKCRWVEMELTGQKGGTVKIWKTDEIVGGAARRVTRHDEAGKMTLTMTAVDWKPAE